MTKFIEVDLDVWDTQELVDELKHRGYPTVDDLTNEDYDFLIKMLGDMPHDWRVISIREKLLKARYG